MRWFSEPQEAGGGICVLAFAPQHLVGHALDLTLLLEDGAVHCLPAEDPAALTKRAARSRRRLTRRAASSVVGWERGFVAFRDGAAVPESALMLVRLSGSTWAVDVFRRENLQHLPTLPDRIETVAAPGALAVLAGGLLVAERQGGGGSDLLCSVDTVTGEVIRHVPRPRRFEWAVMAATEDERILLITSRVPFQVDALARLGQVRQLDATTATLRLREVLAPESLVRVLGSGFPALGMPAFVHYGDCELEGVMSEYVLGDEAGDFPVQLERRRDGGLTWVNRRTSWDSHARAAVLRLPTPLTSEGTSFEEPLICGPWDFGCSYAVGAGPAAVNELLTLGTAEVRVAHADFKRGVAVWVGIPLARGPMSCTFTTFMDRSMAWWRQEDTWLTVHVRNFPDRFRAHAFATMEAVHRGDTIRGLAEGVRVETEPPGSVVTLRGAFSHHIVSARAPDQFSVVAESRVRRVSVMPHLDWVEVWTDAGEYFREDVASTARLLPWHWQVERRVSGRIVAVRVCRDRRAFELYEQVR